MSRSRTCSIWGGGLQSLKRHWLPRTTCLGETLLADEKASPKDKKRFPLLPTYELALKCSNLFNILDARGAISVTERVGVIGRIRNLAVAVAKAYATQQAA